MNIDYFIIILCGIAFCISFYVYGFYKGSSWAQKEFEDALNLSDKTFEEAMKLVKQYKESSERLLREKYSIVNGKGFENADKN